MKPPYIALESEGGKVDWRNVRIKQLPAGKGTPEQTAPAWDGRVSLYDGRSLKRWNSRALTEAGWKPADWELVCSGNNTPLIFDKKSGDFQSQPDVRAESKEPTSAKPVCINGVPVAAPVSERWKRYHIVRRCVMLSCRDEDQDAGPEIPCGAGPAELSLKSGTPLRVASLYLKE